LEENYYALAISILKGCTPEQAFELLENGRIKRKKHSSGNSVEEMIVLKSQGFTYKQIGEMFGMSNKAVYNRIRRKRA
jgi:hypothetical protein